MELGRIPQGIKKAAKEFSEKLHQQELQTAANKIEKQIAQDEELIQRTRNANSDHIGFDL
jgi:F0F1-type ATP synthase membrane subunit b/b'